MNRFRFDYTLSITLSYPFPLQLVLKTIGNSMLMAFHVGMSMVDIKARFERRATAKR